MTALHNPAKEYVAMPLEGVQGADWKPVKHPGIVPGYQVSLYGEVKTPRGRIAKPQWRKNKFIVALRMAGSPNSTTLPLAVLVLSAFDHYEPDMVPDYIDSDSTNCQLINLRWREPTVFEARAKKATVTARKARSKGGTAKKAPSPPPPRASGEVEVMRVYKHGGLTIPVSPEGEIPAKALPQGRLSAQKVASLAKILAMVVEMNDIMRLGR